MILLSKEMLLGLYLFDICSRISLTTVTCHLDREVIVLLFLHLILGKSLKYDCGCAVDSEKQKSQWNTSDRCCFPRGIPMLPPPMVSYTFWFHFEPVGKWKSIKLSLIGDMTSRWHGVNTQKYESGWAK